MCASCCSGIAGHFFVETLKNVQAHAPVHTPPGTGVSWYLRLYIITQAPPGASALAYGCVGATGASASYLN